MINVVVERDVRHVDSSRPPVNMSCEAFSRRLDMVCFYMKRVSVVRRKVLMKLAATIPTLLIPPIAFDEGLHDIMSSVVFPFGWWSSWFDRLSQLSMVIQQGLEIVDFYPENFGKMLAFGWVIGGLR